jgi:predicted PurR-regulated permease PerM
MKKNILILHMPAPLIALIGYMLSVTVIILCLKYITLIAAPIFFSFIIAYLFTPVVDFWEKRHIHRGITAALIMIGLIIFFIVLMMILFPYVVEELKKASDRFPQTLSQFYAKVKIISDYITKNFSEYVGNFDLVGKIEKMISNSLNNISNILVSAFSSIYSILITILYVVFIPLVSYYFLKDERQIQRSFFSIIPLRSKDQVIQKLDKMNNILSAFIRGQAIVVLILILFYCVGLSLIGLPFGILIGVIAGVGDFIPYFGTVLGFILSLIVGVAHFESFEKLLLIVLVFVMVKGSENWFFYPKIVGKKVGLHFLWVLAAIVFFGNIFGFWGLVVAIPSAAGLKMHLDDLIKYYKNSHFFKKE